MPVDVEDFLRILEEDPDIVGERGRRSRRGLRTAARRTPEASAATGARSCAMTSNVGATTTNSTRSSPPSRSTTSTSSTAGLSPHRQCLTRRPSWITSGRALPRTVGRGRFARCCRGRSRDGVECDRVRGPTGDPSPAADARGNRRVRDGSRRGRRGRPCVSSHSATARSPVRGSPTRPTSGCVRHCTGWSWSRRSR